MNNLGKNERKQAKLSYIWLNVCLKISKVFKKNKSGRFLEVHFRKYIE